jgi:protein arginine kinase activator
MICDECNQRPATMHFTRVVNGEKTEVHLCQQCAQEKGEMFMMQGGTGFSLNNLLAGLLNFENTYQHQGHGAIDKEEFIQCPSCSMTFPQFVKAGRFGCTACYEAFSGQLKPIIRRVHGGNWKHHGKIPKRVGGTLHIRRQLEESKQRLKDLITKEEFEKAAKVRDEIRSLEKLIKGTSEGGE